MFHNRQLNQKINKIQERALRITYQDTESTNRQRKIRIEIDNTKELYKKKALKVERNEMQHQISHKVQESREKEIDMKIEDIEIAQIHKNVQSSWNIISSEI